MSAAIAGPAMTIASAILPRILFITRPHDSPLAKHSMPSNSRLLPGGHIKKGFDRLPAKASLSASAPSLRGVARISLSLRPARNNNGARAQGAVMTAPPGPTAARTPPAPDARGPQIVSAGGTAALHLTLAVCDYEHVREIAQGLVRADGITLTPLIFPSIEEITFRFTRALEWDVSELS